MGREAEGGGPYVSVTAEPEANHRDQTPAASHAPWVRAIGDYERRKTTISRARVTASLSDSSGRLGSRGWD